MITSSAHPDDDPWGEEVLVGGTVVMTTEDLKVVCRASPTQLLPILIDMVLPSSSKLTVRSNCPQYLLTLFKISTFGFT